jgi:hypothetical protein
MKTKSAMAGLRPPGYRSAQALRRRRRRRLTVLTVVVSLVGVGAVGLAVAAVATRGAGATRDAEGTAAPVAAPRGMLVLALRGEHPLAAVIAALGSSAPAAVAVPHDMTFTVPGQGEATVAEAAALDGTSFRVAVSNLLGVWADHYAVMDRETLAALVDRIGGVEVELGAAPTDGEMLGRESTLLSGEQSQEYLGEGGPSLELRWELFLEGLLAAKPLALPDDFVETDDPAAAAAILEAAAGAPVQQLPVEDLGGALDRPLVRVDPEELPEFVAAAFGIEPPQPAPVIVVNGSGTPSVGQTVAERIVPVGFRVVLSQNADRFDEQRTAVIASGEEHIEEATRAQQALGVGEVQVTKVPSGVADVTIVVGKDFGSG